MWREQYGCFEMLLAYIVENASSVGTNQTYRDFLVQILTTHQEHLKQQRESVLPSEHNSEIIQRLREENRTLQNKIKTYEESLNSARSTNLQIQQKALKSKLNELRQKIKEIESAALSNEEECETRQAEDGLLILKESSSGESNDTGILHNGLDGDSVLVVANIDDESSQCVDVAASSIISRDSPQTCTILTSTESDCVKQFQSPPPSTFKVDIDIPNDVSTAEMDDADANLTLPCVSEVIDESSIIDNPSFKKAPFPDVLDDGNIKRQNIRRTFGSGVRKKRIVKEIRRSGRQRWFPFKLSDERGFTLDSKLDFLKTGLSKLDDSSSCQKEGKEVSLSISSNKFHQHPHQLVYHSNNHQWSQPSRRKGRLDASSLQVSSPENTTSLVESSVQDSEMYVSTPGGFQQKSSDPSEELAFHNIEAEESQKRTIDRREMSSQNSLTCSFCGRCFKYPKRLEEHEKIHAKSSTDGLKCSLCLKTFKYLKNFVKHRRMHKAIKNFRTNVYPCAICQRPFAYYKAKVRHECYQHGVQSKQRFILAKEHSSHSQKSQTNSPITRRMSRTQGSISDDYLPSTVMEHEPVQEQNLPTSVSDTTQMEIQLQTSHTLIANGGVPEDEHSELPELTQQPLIQYRDGRSHLRKSDKEQSLMPESGNPTALSLVHRIEQLPADNPSQIKCSLCSRVFKHRMHLARHEKSHGQTSQRKSIYPCSFCKRPFTYYPAKVRHERFHHGIPRKSESHQKSPIASTACYSLRSYHPTQAEQASGEVQQKGLFGNENVQLVEKSLATMEHDSASLPSKLLDSAPETETFSTQNPDLIKCSLCSKEFKCRKHLIRHENNHKRAGRVISHRKNIYPCSLCKRPFTFYLAKVRHEHFHHGIQHYRELHREPMLESTECYSLRSSKANSEEQASRVDQQHEYENIHLIKEPVTMMDDLGTSLSSGSAQLVRDAKNLSDIKEKQFRCSSCSKIFKYEKNLIKHLRIHGRRESRPKSIYPCTFCKRPFTYYPAKVRHENTHQRFHRAKSLLSQSDLSTRLRRHISQSPSPSTVLQEVTQSSNPAQPEHMLQSSDTNLAPVVTSTPQQRGRSPPTTIFTTTIIEKRSSSELIDSATSEYPVQDGSRRRRNASQSSTVSATATIKRRASETLSEQVASKSIMAASIHGFSSLDHQFQGSQSTLQMQSDITDLPARINSTDKCATTDDVLSNPIENGLGLFGKATSSPHMNATRRLREQRPSMEALSEKSPIFRQWSMNSKTIKSSIISKSPKLNVCETNLQNLPTSNQFHSV